MRLLPSSLITLPLAILLHSGISVADPIPVRHKEGTVHGYLALRTLDGKIVAAGDVVQTVHGDRVTTHLMYRFRDGSIDDDTSVFSQRGAFRLISDHHIQKGPTFPKPMDVMIEAASGQVTVRYQDKDQEKVETSHMDLPLDLANGMLLDVLKNIPFQSPVTTLSYLATTPKPRLIHVTVKPDGEERFESAGLMNKALRFVLHVEIGGIAGMIAPLIGKEIPDTHAWVSAGLVPAFIRSEEPLYLGGPILRTELISPVWPRSPQTTASRK